MNFDVLIPKNNEKELIEEAIRLKYKEIVMLTDKKEYKLDDSVKTTVTKSKIIIKTAFFLRNPAEFSRVRNKFDYIFAYPERKFFEMNIDYVFNLEMLPEKDSFHFRRTPLNQVTAKLCSEHSIKIAFEYSLVENKVALGRMMQNSVLIRKYKLDFDVFSFASSVNEMHSKNKMKSLLNVLGMK